VCSACTWWAICRAPTGSAPRSASGPSALALLERGHRQPCVVQLLPVVLGGLARAGPDDRLAGVVDLVGDRVALLERDAGDDARQRGRHAVEGVVVVVQDDHPPVVVQAGARLAGA